MKLAGVSSVWIGGKRLAGKDGWQWLDGRTWGYQNWSDPANTEFASIPRNCQGCDCVVSAQGSSDEALNGWIDLECTRNLPFICANPTIRRSGNHTFVVRRDPSSLNSVSAQLAPPKTRKASLLYQTFNFWWNQTLDSNNSTVSGLKIDWRIENGQIPDERQFLSEISIWCAKEAHRYGKKVEEEKIGETADTRTNCLF